MGINTKLKLTDAKFEQPVGGVLTLSGQTLFEKAEYIGLPTLLEDQELAHKKYVDDSLTEVTYDNVWMSGTSEGVTLDTWYDVTQSAGRFTGGVITVNDAESGTIDVAAGTGLIKDENTDIAPNRYVEWDAVTALQLQAGYNYVFYEASSNTIVASTNEANIKNNRNFNLGRVFWDDSANEIIVRLCGQNLWNLNRRLHRVGDELFGVQRASGMVTTSSSGRYIQVSAGVLWAELLNRFETTSFDSNVTDFSEWYVVSGDWSRSSQSQIRDVWNDTSGVEVLDGDYYGVQWVYVVHDGSVHIILHDEQYSGITEARLSLPPAVLPSLVAGYATLSARIIVKEGESGIFEISSAFDKVFTTTIPAQHNDLGGIDGSGTYHISAQGALDVQDIPEMRDITDVAITGVTNGLTKVGSHSAKLGGDLTEDTIIDGDDVHDLTFTKIDNFNLDFDNVSVITDNSTNGGIRYGGDYSGNYVERSLVDAGYVTGLTSAIMDDVYEIQQELPLTLTGVTNGLTKEDRDVKLGGTLTEPTTISGSQSLNLNLNKVDIGGATSGVTVSGSGLYLTGTIQGTGGLLCLGAGGEVCQTSLAAFGGITGATNGLTDCGNQQIGLGGTLCADTSISGAGFDLSLGTSGSKLDLLDVHTSGNIGVTSDANLVMSLSGGTITTSDLRGLRYTADYTDTFVNNSLVSKLYVDTVATGLDPKSSVNVATTGSNITLDSLTSSPIDGVTLVDGMRVLVKDQTVAEDNGIYIVNDSGAWTRSLDFDGNPQGEVQQGALVPVLSGSTNINTSWILVTPNPIVVGTDPLVFTKFSQLLDIAEGNGIDISTLGQTKTISVELASNSGLEFVGTGLSVDDLIAGNGLTWNAGVINVNAPSGGTASSIAVKRNGGDNLVVNTSEINTALGGVLSGTTNGLSEITTGIVGLGGALTQATTISGNSTNQLTYLDGEISTPRGILYGGDYSSTFVDRSLVDKGYVDAEITDAITGVTLTFGNGLTKTGQNVKLGGLLTENTQIETSGSRELIIGDSGLTSYFRHYNNNCSEIYQENGVDYGLFQLRSDNSYWGVVSDNIENEIYLNLDEIFITSSNYSVNNCSHLDLAFGCIRLLSNNSDGCKSIEFTGNNIITQSTFTGFTGIQYDANYGANFVNRSLVDKEYVDGQVSGATLTYNNGLTKTGQVVSLGGTLTGNTIINTDNKLFSVVGTYTCLNHATNYLQVGVLGTGIDIQSDYIRLNTSGNTTAIYLNEIGVIDITGTVTLQTSPSGGTTSDALLVWNSTDKQVKQIDGAAVLTAAITGATNGLTKVGQDVKLGGTQLSETTTIVGNGQIFTLTGLTDLNLGATTVDITGAVTLLTAPATGTTSDWVLVRDTSTGEVKQIDPANLGEDNNDYSKLIVTGSTTLDAESPYVILVNHTAPVTITLPATPFDGQAFKIKDAANDALSNNITIARNGNTIDKQTLDATINTDSGALELLYDSSLGWFSLAFIN